jgi:hypothetical protein
MKIAVRISEENKELFIATLADAMVHVHGCPGLAFIASVIGGGDELTRKACEAARDLLNAVDAISENGRQITDEAAARRS